MVGYHSSNTYRVYCPTNRRIEFACDVKFNEQAKCHISTNSSNIDKNLNSINNDDQNLSFSSNESTDLNHHDQTVTKNKTSILSTTIGEVTKMLSILDDDSEKCCNNQSTIGRGSSNRRYEINPERINSLRPRSNESECGHCWQ
ncbi:hypothetical protein HUG17_1188 [Dermatophagoides farinae]|uniref:Retroviral polymerase SH3-like domain-containing protein n=1 Tax=Dermatophagoides farinae TaxID=6954 RepID=A0A9D4P9Q3_DERFA|nr:hypothetical protein HUG17_1188 [Dermatophagoides farinae]